MQLTLRIVVNMISQSFVPLIFKPATFLPTSFNSFPASAFQLLPAPSSSLQLLRVLLDAIEETYNRSSSYLLKPLPMSMDLFLFPLFFSRLTEFSSSRLFFSFIVLDERIRWQRHTGQETDELSHLNLLKLYNR